MIRALLVVAVAFLLWCPFCVHGQAIEEFGDSGSGVDLAAFFGTLTDGRVCTYATSTGKISCDAALATDNSNEGAIIKKSGGVFSDAVAGTDYYTPTSPVALVAGTTAVGTAPLKFQTGTNLTTPEAGVVEYDGTNFYFTPSVVVGRKTVSFTDHTHSGVYEPADANIIKKGTLTNGKWCTTDGTTVSCTSDTPSGGLPAWQAKTTDYAAVTGDRIIADTSGGAFPITLPATPSAGNEVTIIDGAGSFGTYNLTVSRNSEKINGEAADLTLNVNNAHVQLVYYNATYGWRVLNMR